MKTTANLKFAMMLSLKQRKHDQQGFTLIEVIVAVVVLSIFILAATSALVVGINGKLKGKLNNEATLLIQQDLEKVRYAATQFGYQVKVNSSTMSPITTATSTTSLYKTVYSNGTTTFTSSAPAAPTAPTTIISSNQTIDLTLSIPVITSSPQSYISAANTGLRIGSENNAYRLTTAITPPSSPTSLSVTVDLSNVSPLNSTTLASAASGTFITVPSAADLNKFRSNDRIVVGLLTSGATIFSSTVTSIDIPTLRVNFTNAISGYASGTPVTILPRIGELITNNDLCISTTTNIATTFRDALPSLVSANVYLVKFNPNDTRQYQVTRTPTPKSQTGVEIVYGVKDLSFSTGTDLAALTTEVVPNVTFLCP